MYIKENFIHFARMALKAGRSWGKKRNAHDIYNDDNYYIILLLKRISGFFASSSSDSLERLRRYAMFLFLFCFV